VIRKNSPGRRRLDQGSKVLDQIPGSEPFEDDRKAEHDP
jgi:hypothetical protein